ncbi:MAG: AraC family transcriptional regulator [Ignavibacteriaceae bacterium]|nr:AraC family transcriptional regulator [Ignavibacteriaceae bacterium]
MDSLLEKPKIYLKTAIALILFILLTDEINYLGVWKESYNLIPFNYFALFSIYPLIYIYSRDLIFNGTGLHRQPVLKFLLFPIIVITSFSIYFYSQDDSVKVALTTQHLSNFSGISIMTLWFKNLLIYSYYAQAVFYIFLTIALILKAKKSFPGNFFEIKVIRYVSFYLAGIVAYESLILAFILGLALNDNEKRIMELILSMSFVIYGLYISFNQTLLLIQSRIERFHRRIEIPKRQHNIHPSPPTEKEMAEIRVQLEEFLIRSKVYLDPNLTIDNLAKKVHIPSRKISIVINHLYNKNFHTFINDFRISEAKKLLKTPGNSNIEDIYGKVGFNSRSTFNRVFKSGTGKSPSDYISSDNTE